LSPNIDKYKPQTKTNTQYTYQQTHIEVKKFDKNNNNHKISYIL